jgi:chlorite dismutase
MAREASAVPETRRQVVSFTFYQVDPHWRKLDRPQREQHRHEFTEALQRWEIADLMRTLTYSTVGTRADCDMMLWRICHSVDDLQQMTAELLATGLGAYLRTTHSYIAITKRSQYLIAHEHQRHYDTRGVVQPGGCKYLVIYPFARTRDWYQLPHEERQRMVNENVGLMHEFPSLKLHVAYSYGVDNQDYVMAFESDHAEQMMDFAHRMRENDSNSFVARDQPVFLCVRVTPVEMLTRVG